ncbi:MAG: CoA-transferase subunit beta [Anaerolineales bacterium]|nr:CoA-transferase subunit beta [Anaerolineales bacterium]MCB9127244.1 CoA-transferase [Ardenticatenales bacterium]MCB9172931.1 CoA-transferase [Ardenticatenales bacterium]
MSEGELMMIVAAAREIADGETVFVGMRRPMLAFALAQRLHAPSAVGLYENGIVRQRPTTPVARTMGDPRMTAGATWVGGMATVMGLLAQGHVDLGLLGAGQVDRFGNLNSSYIGDYARPERRLPGSGGSSDITSLAKRCVVLLPHQPQRLVEAVDYLTAPGHGSGSGWRDGVGLPATSAGTTVVVTDLAVLRADAEGELWLTALHAGATVEAVQAATGWPLKISDALRQSAAPTEEECAALAALRQG